MRGQADGFPPTPLSLAKQRSFSSAHQPPPPAPLPPATMLLPPWLVCGLATPALSPAQADAAAAWLATAWFGRGGEAARRALARARAVGEARAAVAGLEPPARAVLEALASEPAAGRHVGVLAGLMFRVDDADAEIDADARQRRTRDANAAAVAALRIVFGHPDEVFEEPIVRRRGRRRSYRWRWEKDGEEGAEERDEGEEEEARSDGAMEALRRRVSALEAELAVSRAAAAELQANFHFWARLVLAEVRTTSAVDAAGRAALAVSITRLQAGAGPPTGEGGGGADLAVGSSGESQSPASAGGLAGVSGPVPGAGLGSAEFSRTTVESVDCGADFGERTRCGGSGAVSVVADGGVGKVATFDGQEEWEEARAAFFAAIGDGKQGDESQRRAIALYTEVPVRVFRSGRWELTTSSSVPSSELSARDEFARRVPLNSSSIVGMHGSRA